MGPEPTGAHVNCGEPAEGAARVTPQAGDWTMHGVALRVGVTDGDVLIWTIFLGLPFYIDPFGNAWIADADVEALARLPRLPLDGQPPAPEDAWPWATTAGASR